MNNEMEHLNSKQVYLKLEEASKQWSEWQEKSIALDEGRKATFSKCFIRHKLDTKTVIEAEHKARIDPEYIQIVEHYSQAEGNLIKCKLHYNNLDRYASLKQSELKRDLSLVGKQEG
jgi:hypothetical protein|tara:strand:+ start:880 stop:1230 length:351 start_codon:yes stop_codon:yes gene_type:complete